MSTKPKQTETCPHCGGQGKYVKGWSMKQRRQEKGKPQGTFNETGKVTKVYLYKCQNSDCKRNFRKGETVKEE